VPTPGVILPKRRVLTPQPTALATVKKWERIKREVGPTGKPLITPEAFAIEKWSNYYAAARANDLGFSPYLRDPELRDWTDKIYNSLAKTQMKFSKKHQRKLARSRHPDIFNPWISARHAFATLGERTGVPLLHIYDKIMRKAGTAWIAGYDAMSEIKLRHLTGLTPKDNKDISWYLFSPKTRAAVIDDISDNALFLAEKINDVLQGPAAKDVQEMVFRRWVISGKAPMDVKKYGNPDTILKEGVQAKADGRLKEWIANQPRWGVRQFYYMSDPVKHDIIDDYLNHVSMRALHKPQVSDESMPGTLSYESYVRKGTPPIKEGSVPVNVLTHIQRIKIANAVADDYELMQSRLNEIDLSNADKQGISNIFSNLMMKRQIIGQPWKTALEVKRWFWRTRLSPLANPEDVIWMCTRQALQNFAMGPTAINLREAVKIAFTDGRQVMTGKSLEDIDPEIWARLQRDFPSYVSQRRAVYREFLLQDTGNITKEFGNRALAQKAASLLERTGGGYAWFDEYTNRLALWWTQARITKAAPSDYINGKINLNQFLSRTNLNTVRRDQKLMIADLLDQGRIDDLAAESANWIAEDVHLKYKTAERAGVSQTMPQRLAMGIYDFPKGAVELLAYRGVIPFLKGVRDGDWGQAKAGLTNIIKGVAAGTIVATFMGVVIGRKAYDMQSKLRYQLLGPGLGSIAEILDANARQWYLYSKGEQGLYDTIDNIADAFAASADEFIPMAGIFASTVESMTGTAGLSSWKIVKDGVAAKLFGKDADWKKIERTGWQKLMHVVIGSYEYPEKEPVLPGKGERTRGERGTR